VSETPPEDPPPEATAPPEAGPSPDPSPAPPSPLRLLGLTLGGLLLAACLVALQSARLERFAPRSHDLAIYAQLVWSAGGGELTSSIQQTHALAVHWSPLLLLLGPVARLFDPVSVLLVVQGLALGSLAPGLYLALRARTGESAATWIGAAALLYPPVWTVGLNGFHPVTLGVPLALALFWALDRGRPRLALVLALVLGLGVKEVSPLVVLGLGPYLWTRRQWRLGAAMAGLGLGMFVLEMQVLLPAVRQGAIQLQRPYAHLGDSIFQVALSPLLRPGALVDTLTRPHLLGWALGLLLPLAALPLRRPSLLLPALPLAALHLLSSRPEQQDLLNHYHASLLPWLLLAAGLALDTPKARRVALPALGVGLLGGLLWFAEPKTAITDLAAPDDPRARVTATLVGRIPPGEPAVGTVDVLAALSAREGLWGVAGVVRGTKDYSTLPYDPAPPQAWILCDANDEGSFWPNDPSVLRSPALAPPAARWRTLALDPARGWGGGAEGLVLLSPGAGANLVTHQPQARSDDAFPRLLSAEQVEQGEAGLEGVAVFDLILAGPSQPTNVGPLFLQADYLSDHNDNPVRTARWPALYRLLDHASWDGGYRVRLGLLTVAPRARLTLLGVSPPGSAQPLRALPPPLEVSLR
jgi:uncharacterized membrane protein